jgi:hypothetical protein
MATKQQIPKLLSVLVEHQRAFDVLSNEDAQWVILNGKYAIALACEAWKSRVADETRVITIDRTNPFNPAEFIGSGWSFWCGPEKGNGLEGDIEQDSRSLEMTEVDLSKILLETHLKGRETYTTGDEHVQRLIYSDRILLDLGVFKTFWDKKVLIPTLFKEKIGGNITYVFFDGQTLRSPSGNRCTMYLCIDDDGEWSWSVNGLVNYRHVNDPSAVLQS